uniref:Uncharacterized protein n=1 Tax=Glossina palpalis gambiensis TaxID=67801 RepID=A0A1B0BZ60_9MUSC
MPCLSVSSSIFSNSSNMAEHESHLLSSVSSVVTNIMPVSSNSSSMVSKATKVRSHFSPGSQAPVKKTTTYSWSLIKFVKISSLLRVSPSNVSDELANQAIHPLSLDRHRKHVVCHAQIRPSREVKKISSTTELKQAACVYEKLNKQNKEKIKCHDYSIDFVTGKNLLSSLEDNLFENNINCNI